MRHYAIAFTEARDNLASAKNAARGSRNVAVRMINRSTSGIGGWRKKTNEMGKEEKEWGE